jgi:dihydroxyacetone kinase-like predicted kinase
LVLAFVAIELVGLPRLLIPPRVNEIAAIPTVDNVCAIASANILHLIVAEDGAHVLAIEGAFARPSVDDVVAVIPINLVFTAKAAYLVIALQTSQQVWFVGA